MSGYTGQRGPNGKLLATGVAALFLVLIGFLFSHIASERASEEEFFRVQEAALQSGEYAAMSSAVQALGERLEGDDRAPAALLALDARAELVFALLFSGSTAQRAQALRLLARAQALDPTQLEVRLTEALAEASIADPERAITLLEDGSLQARYPLWARLIRAEADLRRGMEPKPDELVAIQPGGLLGVWGLRIAWAQGNADLVGSLAARVLADAPGNVFAETLILLASSRAEDHSGALERLRGLFDSAAALPPALGSLVAVDLARLMRKQGESEAAQLMLLDLADQIPDSDLLQVELARAERFQSHFGAAFDRADKALRDNPAAPRLLTEMSAALFFRDSAEKISSRLRLVPESQKKTDGVRRASAMMSLLQGNYVDAVEALSATRHLGMPGDTEIWLAEALLGAGRPDEALIEAKRAREEFVRLEGPRSHPATIAALYEGLALQALGQSRSAKKLMESTYVRPFQTPWAAWLYGRYLEEKGKNRAAKDLFLLACHHGQDFALSCYHLSQIYQSLRLDEVERSTQRKACELYLRNAPKGVHAEQARKTLEGQ